MLTTTKNRITKAIAGGALAAAAVTGAVTVGAAPAEARTSTWYAIPSLNAATGGVIMDSFSKGFASGYASGRVWLRSNGQNLYIQRKPNEGGLWKRITQNQTTSSTQYYYWNDSFTLNYSGFMFRICKDNPIVGDTCGSAVKVYG